MANKKINEGLKTEGELVKALRGERSYREFEGYLNEKIPAGMPGFTTFQSVWNWERDIHAVTASCLMAWMHFYLPNDPRHVLAVDVFALRTLKAHWVKTAEYPQVDEPELKKEDGKKLLKAVKVVGK